MPDRPSAEAPTPGGPGETPADPRRRAAFARLAERFGPRFETRQAVRAQHAATTTWLQPQPPEAVVFPRSTEEVAEIVRLCAEHRLPVIPFGAGSSLEGHVNAPAGGAVGRSLGDGPDPCGP